MKSLITAAVALVAIAGTGWLVAQNDDHALRLWLIDRIEDAYVNGDTETLRRMAEHEYEHDIGEWLDRQSNDPTRITQAMGGGPSGATCPPGTTYVESDGLCHQNPSTEPTGPPVPPIPDFEPGPIPPPPPPPVQVPTPTPTPTPLPKPKVNPACLNALQLVAQCWAEREVIRRIADEADADEKDRNPQAPDSSDLQALKQACSDKGVECTVKTLAAANLCAAG